MLASLISSPGLRALTTMPLHFGAKYYKVLMLSATFFTHSAGRLRNLTYIKQALLRKPVRHGGLQRDTY
ncbi:hypothetical protein KCP77_15280 [Salmonella enterica subsp. enterica]|nr:hypothetical protein KCP77_15280 [Salmonella enterica subsp. enterica]